MASLLRSLVSSPRLAHHPSLDLTYISASSPTIIAMSTPATTFPYNTYRNPASSVLEFLDATHGRDNWWIWELQAEGTDYDTALFGGRVSSVRWPDHLPPPFALVVRAVGEMGAWVKDGKTPTPTPTPTTPTPTSSPPSIVEHTGTNKHNPTKPRIIVLHCKAGKGRSGTLSCAYLITHATFSAPDALALFTRTRMRPGFGEGVSIPSQRRYVHYVEQWARDHNHQYIEHRVRIHEVHVFGLRKGVVVAVRGWEDDDESAAAAAAVGKLGRGGKCSDTDTGTTTTLSEPDRAKPKPLGESLKIWHTFTDAERRLTSPPSSSLSTPSSSSSTTTTIDCILIPPTPLLLPTNDVNIAFKQTVSPSWSPLSSIAITTATANVWFNAFFEGGGEGGIDGGDRGDGGSGVFEALWEDMDGVKGTEMRGGRCVERVRVVWSVEGRGA
ncbi:phosphatases II [Ascodesmis nigricans]|uniref:phosphatidylinositol-3,4,5-trisphosphate 3-phosphatase n=1 Tax=Ascodesmis nigricans TaxID=341454 RepID=A0A4S2MN71_9PEZI|nr:phosphatases II [Ascodesmis nigricans]